MFLIYKKSQVRQNQPEFQNLVSKKKTKKTGNPVLWSLTRAAVKLWLFQDKYFSYSIPRRGNVGQKYLAIFSGL